jgi:hypothetical protein
MLIKSVATITEEAMQPETEGSNKGRSNYLINTGRRKKKMN